MWAVYSESSLSFLFLALSTLQNGILPRMLTVELLEELFERDNPRPFMMDLRKGLDSLGIYKVH